MELKKKKRKKTKLNLELVELLIESIAYRYPELFSVMHSLIRLTLLSSCLKIKLAPVLLSPARTLQYSHLEQSSANILMRCFSALAEYCERWCFLSVSLSMVCLLLQ